MEGRGEEGVVVVAVADLLCLHLFCASFLFG